MAIYNQNIRELTLISNNCGWDNKGIGMLLEKK